MANGEVRCIDSELPFELPEGWEWVRMNELGIYRKGPFGSSLTKSMFVPQDKTTVKVYEQKNAIQKDYRLGDYYISNEKFKSMQSFIAQPNDIIVSCAGTIGETYLLPEEAPVGIINQALMRVCLYHLSMADFWQIFFAYVIVKESKMKGAGSAIKNIPPFEYLKSILVPIPPEKEQMRIVDCYNHLLKEIDSYEELREEKNSLNSSIYSKLKKSILQEAIQGNLVSQCDTDEPASKLLERIKDEKLKLVKAGKLKAKDIVDSVIFKGEDNKYYEQINGSAIEIAADYDFPSTWKIVRLADVCRLTDGEKKQGKHICLDAKYLRGKSNGDCLDKGKFVTAGDNIILVDGENSGEVFTVPCDGYMGSTFKQLWVSAEMHLPFVLYFIQFYKDHLRNSKKGAAIPHLNKDIFYNLLIGVPPITEQARISSKIEELYSNL